MLAGKMQVQDDLVTLQPTHGRSLAQYIANKDPGADPDVVDFVTVRRCPLYHAAMTITAAQPGLLVPQPTGDLLRITLPYAGPTLSATAPTTKKAVGGACSARAQQFLLPATMPHYTVPSHEQHLYRGHQQPIVAAAVLHDATALLTVDLGGLVALWPTHDSAASPVGWFEPTRTKQLATHFLAPVLRGAVVMDPQDQGKASMEAGLEAIADGATCPQRGNDFPGCIAPDHLSGLCCSQVELWFH